MTMTHDEIIEGLRKIDTPTITNVVATYPNNPLCLGLYNPWTENWYTDTSIKCIYPGRGATVGYAATCVWGLPDPNFVNRRSMLDMLEAIETMKKPTILVMQQKWPEGIKQRAGLAGEVMVTCMKAVGCVGMVSDGPSRDIDAIRQLDFQLLLGGVTAGHGEMAIQSINVPVSVGGMDVAPGEMVHMDENGAVKFPAEHAQLVLENAHKFLDAERQQLEFLRKARSVADIKAAFAPQPSSYISVASENADAT